MVKSTDGQIRSMFQYHQSEL